MGRLGRMAPAAALAGVLLVGCGGGPTLPPLADDPDDTSAGGPVDGCRPALGEDDPHPIRDGGGEGGQHPALEGPWVSDIANAVQSEHTDVLGGLWLDNDAGELVVMVPSTEGREVFEQLRQDAPEPDRVVCMEATYTEDELRDLQQQVHDRLMATGAPVSTGADTVRGVLDVTYEGDPAEAEEALGELAEHPAVEVGVPPCAELVPPPDDAVVLPGGGSTCGGMEALFEGTLAGDPSAGCAWLESPEGEPLTTVWPRGWSITSDGAVVDHRGEERARIGDEVSSGGGHVPLREGQRACGLGGEDGAWVVSDLESAAEG